MANRLEMAMAQAITALWEQGWSIRRIARELGVDRGTVARYARRCRLAGKKAAKAANAPPGISEESADSKAANAPPGISLPPEELSPATVGDSDDSRAALDASRFLPNAPLRGVGPERSFEGEESNPPSLLADAAPGAIHPPSSGEEEGRGPGRVSLCAPFRDVILRKLDEDLSAQRIYQDLVTDHGFVGSYYSVRRFAQRLGHRSAPPFRRLEREPGEEAQVDFGAGALIVREGKRRRPHVFRIVLSHSRKGYSEAVYRQTTEEFLGAIENAFWHWGGVPRVLVIDNLRAAVSKADWFDPELCPKVLSFCQHYGTVILPTKPYTPRHKGKIERGIGYVKGNALKRRTFASLEEENQFLAKWEAGVADQRVHGTTRQQVGRLFEQERARLQPLPTERFPFFHEGQRRVHRDGHVEVKKAYYSVPPEYLGRTVWVRWDARIVRIFNSRLEQVALHARQNPGKFSTLPVHLADEKISTVERGAASMLAKARLIGDQTARWAEAMLKARGIEGLRVLLGLLTLANKHPAAAIEQACGTATSYGAFRLRTLRQLIGRQAPKQESMEFLDEHPIIRGLSDYGDLVRSSIHKESFP